MPNRILQEKICTSDTLAALAPAEEVFFYRLMVQCDDFGRFDARPAVLRARCFPLQIDTVSTADVELWLARLAEVGLVDCYEVDGQAYLQMRTWERYQQTRAKHSKYPPPPPSDSSGNHLQADASKRAHMSPYSYPVSRSEKREPEARGDALAAVAAPPTTPPVDLPAQREARAVPKPKGPSLAPLVDAFTALGLARPSLEGREAAAAQALLRDHPPDVIAACWQDIAAGEYGDEYSNRELSFDLLSRRQRVANWQRWKAQPPAARSPNGSARASPSRSSISKQNGTQRDYVEQALRMGQAVEPEILRAVGLEP